MFPLFLEKDPFFFFDVGHQAPLIYEQERQTHVWETQTIYSQ